MKSFDLSGTGGKLYNNQVIGFLVITVACFDEFAPACFKVTVHIFHEIKVPLGVCGIFFSEVLSANRMSWFCLLCIPGFFLDYPIRIVLLRSTGNSA